MKVQKVGLTSMKSLSVMLCFVVLSWMGGAAWADDNPAIVALAKKIVAEDKARFGIDVKKCRLECQRVYSEAHCVSKCDEISSELRAEGFERERVAADQREEQKPVIYKDAAEKYR